VLLVKKGFDRTLKSAGHFKKVAKRHRGKYLIKIHSIYELFVVLENFQLVSKQKNDIG